MDSWGNVYVTGTNSDNAFKITGVIDVPALAHWGLVALVGLFSFGLLATLAFRRRPNPAT